MRRTRRRSGKRSFDQDIADIERKLAAWKKEDQAARRLMENHDHSQRDVPKHPGARFDHSYYKEKHMPMCQNRFGPACTHYTVDRGLAGVAPGAPAIYVAMCHFFFNSMEVFQAAFGRHGREIMADNPNYTDLSPVIQISEVVVP
jgi:uncharacterized protein (TIGR02118 family)